MNETPPAPESPRPRRENEYEDPHYHDEDDIVPPDDVQKYGSRIPRRKPPRKFPTRRHYHED